jgi:transposase-like protein
MLFTQIDAEAGGASNEGRRPTVVAPPASASPELSDRPRRRTFTARDKLRILAATDRAAETGGIGAILRREGIYSSTLCDWRRQRDAGASGALTPAKRGPKPAEPNPLLAEVALLQRSNAHLTRRLARAEAIIEVQKKLADLLGIPLGTPMTQGGDAP